MAIEWFDPEVRKPEDGEECLIMGHAHRGLVTIAVFGPIPWNEKEQAWLDLFRDPEAGMMVMLDQVGCWTAWKPIEPPAGLPTPFPEPTPQQESETADAEAGATEGTQ